MVEQANNKDGPALRVLAPCKYDEDRACGCQEGQCAAYAERLTAAVCRIERIAHPSRVIDWLEKLAKEIRPKEKT